MSAAICWMVAAPTHLGAHWGYLNLILTLFRAISGCFTLFAIIVVRLSRTQSNPSAKMAHAYRLKSSEPGQHQGLPYY